MDVFVCVHGGEAVNDDGGMQWYAEVGQKEEFDAFEDAKRLDALIAEHREWVKKFNEQEKEHGTVFAG